jgi:Histidine kinase
MHAPVGAVHARESSAMPSPPAAAAAHHDIPPQRARFAVRGLRSGGFGIAIAGALTIAFGFPLWSTLAHSVCIALGCWFTIDSSRLLAARWVYRDAVPGSAQAASRWPGWPWMLPIILVGTIIGFSVGGTVADWITGRPTPGFLRGTVSEGLALLTLSLIPGLAITYWFYSRETIAQQQAAVQTAQRQAAEHQLKLLESQLEPHMLFNTLANLRVLIGIDPPRAQAMLDQLIAFLRATLSGSRASQHALRAEFARLADYLALMQVRMGDRLQMHFELPEALADTLVPPLLLQPLVENCIKHGLEPAVAGGRIDVSAAREDTMLVLRVRDTGAGLADAAAAAAAGEGTQFGLVQVRERLATLYGEQASLTLRAADDGQGGSIATIRLPL